MKTRAGRASTLSVLAVIAAAVVLAWHLRDLDTLQPVAHAALGALWLIMFTAACAGLGWPLVRLALRRPPEGAEDAVVALAAGAGGLTALAWGLSLLGLLEATPLTVVLLTTAAHGGWVVWRRRLDLRPPAVVPVAPAIVVAVVGACAFVSALTVAPLYDQWHQHLGFPWVWLRRGAWTDLPRNVYGGMPANMSLLYTYALSALGPWAAQLTHWWMGALAVAGTASLARRLGGASAAAWAAVILATTPTVAALASTGLSDLGIAAWGVAAWLLVVARSENGEPGSTRALALAGGFVGLAVGCKYLALTSVAVPIAVAVVVMSLTASGAAPRVRVSLARLAALVAGAAVVFSPWAVRNLVATGNPLYPYFARLFGTLSGRDQGMAAEAARWIADFSPGWRQVVAGLDLTSLPGSGDGFAPIGVLYLLLLPAALLLSLGGRFRVATTAVACGGLAGVLAWLPALHCSRYLVGALVPVAAVLGVTVVELLAPLGRAARGALLALLALLVTFNLAAAMTPHGVLRLGCSLGLVPVEQAVAPWVSCWHAVRFVNDSLPPDARVLLVAEARALLIDRDVELEDGHGPPLLAEMAESSADDGAMADALHRRGITHLLVNRQEARRMAAMAGRDDYFATSSPEAAERLSRFFATRLETLWEEHGVGVYRLR